MAWAVAWAALILLVVAPAAAMPLHEFAGTAPADRPAIASARLDHGGPVRSLLRFDEDGQFEAQAARATVWFTERESPPRRTPVPIGPQIGEPVRRELEPLAEAVYDAMDRSTRRIDAEQISIKLVRAGPENAVSLDGGRTSSLVGRECAMRPVSTPHATRATFAGTGGSWWVEADCPSEGQTEGRHSLGLWGVTVRVRYYDDEWHEEQWEAGDVSDESPLAAAGYRRTRSIFVAFESEDSEASWSGVAEGKYAAPRWALAGTLAVPAGNGTLRWGQTTIQPFIPPTKVEGTFWFQGTDKTVLFGGLTGTPPPVPADVVPATPGAGFDWDLALSLSAGVALLWWIGRGVGAALFTRLTPARALEHEKRRLALDFVEANPGATLQDVADALGIDWTTARHHVRMLVHQKLVTMRRVGKVLVLIPGSRAPPPEALKRMAVLRRPRAQRILQMIQANPTWTHQQLAVALGIERSVLSRYLRALRKEGVLEAERRGRRVYYIASTGSSGDSPPATSAP